MSRGITTLVWLRNDLRLADNPALAAAAARGPVVPVYIWSPDEEAPWAPGSAARWWLHQSLAALQKQFQSLGSRLILRQGESLPVLLDLARECGAQAVVWNRCYEPAATARDTRVKAALRQHGLAAESYNGSLLVEPWEIKTKTGGPFQVFTPFWKACQAAGPPREPLPAPQTVDAPGTWPQSAPLAALGLLPKVDWAGGFRSVWQVGETAAQQQLSLFVERAAAQYAERRDYPAEDAVSRLSPHLHFGEISPVQVWHALQTAIPTGRRSHGLTAPQALSVQRQLYWREFAHHLLFHFPHTTDRPLRSEFADFPWRDDRAALTAWQRGQTGYPFVDAGMRQLWQTGWMHNRVRMIVASLLVKDLLLPWQRGAAWFWDTLVDANLANNTLGWQWTAGCGADAAPYFRVFNPVLQGEKFDPDGVYVRRWVPQLAGLPARWIHRPWEAPAEELHSAGVQLGRDYPLPIVDHAAARDRALAALASLKAGR